LELKLSNQNKGELSQANVNSFRCSIHVEVMPKHCWSSHICFCSFILKPWRLFNLGTVIVFKLVGRLHTLVRRCL
jgi:hypothetical protein